MATTKHRHGQILPLPEPSRAALVKAESDHTTFALLEFQSPSTALIAEPAPRTARMMLWIITSMILLAVVSMWFIKVDMVVTAVSVATPHDPNLIVQPLQTAVLKKVYVSEGQSVKKGQLLAELDPTVSTADAKSTVAQMQSLQAQVDRLRAEMANTPYVSDGTAYSIAEAQMWQERHLNYEAQVSSLKSTMQAARAKVQQLQEDEKGLAERLPLAQTIEDKRAQLARTGLDSQLNLLQARDYTAQIRSQLADTQQQVVGAQHDLDGAIQNLIAFVHQWFSQTSDTLDTQERTLSDMTDQATKNKLFNQLVDLKAPQDAIVNSISHVSVGSVLQSGDEVMRLVPTDASIDVVGEIQGSDAGYVKAGQPVTIKFDTLPYLLYGFALGNVTNVSADSFANQPPQQSSPLPTTPSLGYSQPNSLPAVSPVVYMVRADIKEVRVHNVPPGFKVMPGMPITADIGVGRRSVLEYFFERLIPTFVEGMREPS